MIWKSNRIWGFAALLSIVLMQHCGEKEVGNTLENTLWIELESTSINCLHTEDNGTEDTSCTETTCYHLFLSRGIITTKRLNGDTVQEEGNGTYTRNGNKLSININGETFQMTYLITDDQLVLTSLNNPFTNCDTETTYVVGQ